MQRYTEKALFYVRKTIENNWSRAVLLNFTDSVALFEDLWEEWLNTKLYLMVKGTSLLEKGYKGVFESLSEEKQSELIVRKAEFAKIAEIYL